MEQFVEKLTVENFAGIKSAELEFGRLTVIIGPQTTGKSVCAKLLYFFREILQRLPQYIEQDARKSVVINSHVDLFETYFPPNTWGRGVFEVVYTFGEFSAVLRRKGENSNDVDLAYSRYFGTLLTVARKSLEKIRNTDESDLPDHDINSLITDALRERISYDIDGRLYNQIFFVPAGRGFYSQVESSIFTFIKNKVGLDPFIVEFGSFYANLRSSYRYSHPLQDERITNLILGTYVRERGRDYIQTKDGRLVPLENCSSGQQEALPLILSLFRLAQSRWVGATIFVEEPEAHLFPSAQKDVIRLLAHNSGLEMRPGSRQLVITTHSPYILTAINNLMYGGKIVRNEPEKASAVRKLLGDTEVIDPANVTAYLMENGTARSIIDPETSLIMADVIDEVSGDLAAEFDKLLDLAYAEKAA